MCNNIFSIIEKIAVPLFNVLLFAFLLLYIQQQKIEIQKLETKVKQLKLNNADCQIYLDFCRKDLKKLKLECENEKTVSKSKNLYQK